uniref:Uncharacterized protein n=1 Tax=Caenorhabditis japonica TaxID=281687 RepID=A0A8R1I0B0_CAEJA
MDSFFSNGTGDASRTDNPDSMMEDTEVDASMEPEQIEVDDETESHEDSPAPSKNKIKNTTKSIRKRRKRSSSCDSLNDSEEGAKIRRPLANTNKSINVGDEFQARIPEDIDPKPTHIEDPDELVWETPEKINDEKLLSFAKEASDRYRIPIDRALWILTKENFDFDAAILNIAKRNDHRDLWTDDEVRTFHNVYSLIGKHFVVIRQMLPHRSLQSIVQYYYENKKRISYQAFTEFNANASSSSEETEERPTPSDSILEAVCDNCGEQAEKMQVNEALNRIECRACLVYFQLTQNPRPTCLRIVLDERIDRHVECPESMINYMDEYEKLMAPSTGYTYVKRRMGKDQTLDDILGVNRTPPPELNAEFLLESGVNEQNNPEDVGAPLLSPIKMCRDGCRAGSSKSNGRIVDYEMPINEKEDFMIELLKEAEQNSTGSSSSTQNKTTPTVWQAPHTLCMEEMDVLSDDSRRKLFEACLSSSRVNTKEVNSWKNDMAYLKDRMERMSIDVDLIPSILMSNERVQYKQNWTDHEKEDALRCFQWYGNSFNYIADVMGNKTVEQIEEFYAENRELVDTVSDIQPENF